MKKIYRLLANNYITYALTYVIKLVDLKEERRSEAAPYKMKILSVCLFLCSIFIRFDTVWLILMKFGMQEKIRISRPMVSIVGMRNASRTFCGTRVRAA